MPIGTDLFMWRTYAVKATTLEHHQISARGPTSHPALVLPAENTGQ